MSTTFTLVVPDIEFVEFNRIADFNAMLLPTATRALTNCQNFIRYNQINYSFSQFSRDLTSLDYTTPTTLGSTAPVSASFSVTFAKLDALLALYTSGDVSVVSLSNPDTTVYTTNQIKQAGYVLKTLAETVLANSYTEMRPTVETTSSAVLEVQYKQVQAPATNKTITITAS
jgi:hypothetical protein